MPVAQSGTGQNKTGQNRPAMTDKRQSNGVVKELNKEELSKGDAETDEAVN